MATNSRKAGAPNGAPARVIDLDAARAARSEAAQDPVILRLGGQEFTLPPEMPVAFALYAQEGQMLKAIGALLGDQLDAFLEQRPAVSDLEAFADLAGEVYGVSPGEPQASPSS